MFSASDIKSVKDFFTKSLRAGRSQDVDSPTTQFFRKDFESSLTFTNPHKHLDENGGRIEHKNVITKKAHFNPYNDSLIQEFNCSSHL